MEECFKCGVSGDVTILYDAIGREGVVKVCERCAGILDIPIIRRPTNLQLKEAEKKRTVYERLSRAAGVNPSTHRGYDPHEAPLRNLVERKFDEAPPQPKSRDDLIDNFHWTIMRARRSQKLTQKQFAESIGEHEEDIKMAEMGVLPNDSDQLLKKIQTALRINLYKKAPVERKIGFDTTKVSNELTISDLKELKKLKEEKEGKIEVKEEKEVSQKNIDDLEEGEEIDLNNRDVKVGDVKEKIPKKDLSDDEIQDLIFGRKK